MENKFKIAFLSLFIAGITFFSFYPALKNGFVNLDDDQYITSNPVVRSFSPGDLKKIFSTFTLGHYHPLTVLSFVSDYHLFALNASGYHAVNLALHTANCLLVFWLLFTLTGDALVSCIVALLFAIHPLQVESVAWASERKNVLYAFFYLGALVSYCYYLKKGRVPKYYYLTLALFVLSVLSKSMAITLPVVMLMFDFLYRKPGREMHLEKVPFFVLSLLCGLAAVAGVHSSGAFRPEGAYDVATRLMVASYGIAFYLGKLLLPLKLSAFYPYHAPSDPYFYAYACAAAAVVLAGTVYSGRYTKKIIAGGSFFLITLLPALQFVPNGEIITADRYVYISALGVFYIAAEGFAWLWRREKRRCRVCTVLLFAFLLAIVSMCALSTRSRCRVWKNSITLWSDVIGNYPDAATAYNSRGGRYLLNKEYAKAFADFTSALRIDPRYYEAYYNLCTLDAAQGKYGEAQMYCLKAVQINPRLVKAYNSLCSIDGHLGKSAESIAYGEEAIALDPSYGPAHNNLVAAYYYTRQYDLALMHADKAKSLGIAVDPELVARLKEPKK